MLTFTRVCFGMENPCQNAYKYKGVTLICELCIGYIVHVQRTVETIFQTASHVKDRHDVSCTFARIDQHTCIRKCFVYIHILTIEIMTVDSMQ